MLVLDLYYMSEIVSVYVVGTLYLMKNKWLYIINWIKSPPHIAYLSHQLKNQTKKTISLGKTNPILF